MREIRCDVCGKRIYNTDTMTTIKFEYTDNNFHCDLNRTREEWVYECCHDCAYEFNDFDMNEVACLLSSKMQKAKQLKEKKQDEKRSVKRINRGSCYCY